MEGRKREGREGKTERSDFGCSYLFQNSSDLIVVSIKSSVMDQRSTVLLNGNTEYTGTGNSNNNNPEGKHHTLKYY